MTIPNVSLNDGVKIQNNPMVVKQNTTSIDVKSSDDIQRQPQEDNFNGKGLDKKKIITYASIGTTLATLVGIALDFRFAEGKHVKNLWRKLTGNAQDIKPKSNETPNVSGNADVNTPNILDKPDITQPKTKANVEPPKTTDFAHENQVELDKQVKEFFEQEEKELAEIKQAKDLSDWNNERWLNEQHHAKEKEYSDFWNSELEKIEQPLYEQRLKEAEQLKEVIEKDRTKFFEVHKNEIPTEEERYQAFLPSMRTKYGRSFDENSRRARELAKEPEQWLWYLWHKDTKARAMYLDLALKEMKPQDLELYNSAKWLFDNRKLKYNDLDLAHSIYHPELREIIEEVALTGKFDYYGRVSGHHLAYRINSPLRLGFEVDDVLKVILDEGFRTVEPLEQGTTVYRTVCGGKADGSIDFINKLIKAKKGDTFVDKGYSYTSFSERGTSPCNGIRDVGTEDVKLEIIVPKGARVSDGSDYKQSELLFPRNAEFRVVEEATRPEPFVFTNYEGKEVKMPRALRMVVEYILPKA